jgi:branched-chain amino acid transport system permease protein
VDANLIGIIAVLAVAYVVPLYFDSDYLFNAILAPFLALALAAVGLNLLTGYAGQVSLASAAFMAIGADTAYQLTLHAPQIPMLIDFLLAGLFAATVGLLFCLPALRLKGFYLALSTLGTQFFVQWLTDFKWVTNYAQSGVVDAPPIRLFGFPIHTLAEKYVFALTVVVILTLLVSRLVKTQAGLNFIAIRDNELAAKVIGVPILKTKMLVFAISSFVIALGGVLWAFAYLGMIQAGYGSFDLDRSFGVLFSVIIGGLATIRGAFFGAAFIVALPLLLARFGDYLFGQVFDAGVLVMTQKIILGALIIIILMYEPDGLAALFDRIARLLKRLVGMGNDRKEEHVR